MLFVCLICVSLIGGACIRGAYWTEQCGVIGHAGVVWGEGETEWGCSACYMLHAPSLLWMPVQSNPIHLINLFFHAELSCFKVGLTAGFLYWITLNDTSVPNKLVTVFILANSPQQTK